MPLRNAPSVASATLSTIVARLRGRIAPAQGETSDAEALQARVTAALSDSADIAQMGSFIVPAKGLRWLDTGMVLRRGEQITLIGSGLVHLARLLNVSLFPRSTLWYRIGDAPVKLLPGDSGTICAEADGPLQLAALPPGSFADESGAVEKTPLHAMISGGLAVTVIRWRGAPAASLRAAAERDGALFGPLLQRLAHPVRPPAGWHYLWRLGEGELYAPHDGDTGSELCCTTDANVGILQYPVDVPLTPDLNLEWSWLATQLPSRVAEHIELTHDYLSIAVEFDNGLDLTYMWSAAMPPGTVFQCPLPWWKERETHWVVRSQTTDRLGEWLAERRPLHEDYGVAIGEQLPERVVAVWLIANSLFQRQRGECRYRDIRLTGGSSETRINLAP